jgi:glycosyltransferase involved in cell wall biosynthesis
MSVPELRLCIVTTAHSSEQFGGAEYQIDCLVDVLLKTGRYQIDYLAAITSPSFTPNGFRITRIGNGNRIPRFGFLMHAKPLLRTLARIRPNVIYQRVGGGYTALAAYYARRSGARMIWHAAHDNDLNPASLDGGRNPLRRLLEKRSVEYGIRNAHQIVTQTADQAALLERNYGRRADAVISNFHPAPKEKIDKTGPITVLWIANMKPWKQPDTFVRLAERLVDRPDVRFVMVGMPARGAGAQDWGQSVMEQIQRVPNLTHIGEKSQKEVNELLARSHIFVNTSLHEGFANTFIQAWMREAVVVSLHVDPDRILSDKRIGIRAGTESNLHDAVRKLVADRTARAEYASRAKAYVTQHHSLRNADRLEELIRTGRVGEPGQQPSTAAVRDGNATFGQ